MPSCFITFEGGEGVGKSTQIKHLEQKLLSKGHDVIITREPGGTPMAEKIRDLLSDPELGGKWTAQAELLLLFAARAEHISQLIQPALEQGKIVLCDRYIDSTRAYQGYIANIDFDFIYNLEKKIVGDFVPHMTFILDLPVDEAMKRVNSRGAVDHYDRGDKVFYQTLRDGFLKIAEQEKNRCYIIDAMKDQETIADNIYNEVKGHLHEHV